MCTLRQSTSSAAVTTPATPAVTVHSISGRRRDTLLLVEVQEFGNARRSPLAMLSELRITKHSY